MLISKDNLNARTKFSLVFSNCFLDALAFENGCNRKIEIISKKKKAKLIWSNCYFQNEIRLVKFYK